MIALLNATLRVSVILLVGLALVWILRKRSASLRHAVLSIALACAAIVPAVGALVPPWTWPAFDMPPALQALSSPASPVVDALPVLPSSATVQALVTDMETEELPPAAQPDIASSPSRAGQFSVARILDLAFMIYLAGLVVSLGTIAYGLLQLRLILARSKPMRSDYWQWQAAEIADAYHLRRSVRLTHSRLPWMLATWGIFRPQVLLPAGAEDWPEERIRAVLLHELAHVRRNDWITQLLASVLRAVYWFNPLVWIACARLRQQSEHACDGEVIERGIHGSAYAAHLLALARTLVRPTRLLVPAPSMAQPSSLRRRIADILDPAATHARTNGRSMVRAVAAMLAVTWIVAACHVAKPVAHEPEAPPDDAGAPVVVAVAEVEAEPPAQERQSEPIDARPQRDVASSAAVVSPTPQAVAAGILDYVNAELADDVPVPLSQFDYLMRTLVTVQRRSGVLMDVAGPNPRSLAEKSTILLNALGNAANGAIGMASRNNKPRLSAPRLNQLAANLRARAADLADAVIPVSADVRSDADEPMSSLAGTALGLSRSALADLSFVGPRLHNWLTEELTTLERAARSVMSDNGRDPVAAATKQHALRSSANSTMRNAFEISDRADESEETRGKARSLATSLREVASQLDAAMTPLTRSMAAMSQSVSGQVVVPSIGCPTDGQTGPDPAPVNGYRMVTVDANVASRLAYYYSGAGPGLLAPRGWHCQAQAGSAGMNLLVTPDQLPESIVSRPIIGPGIQMSIVVGDTSGRFAAARYIARLFPQERQYVDAVIAEEIEPASSFPSGPYPGDQLTRRGTNVVEYQTPAGTVGLGYDSWLAPDEGPITGVVILQAPDHGIVHLSARLPADLRGLAPTIMRQVETEAALRAVQGPLQ